MIRKIILILVIVLVVPFALVFTLHMGAVAGIYAFIHNKSAALIGHPAATPKPAQAASPAPAAESKDSGSVYTVESGDNPITIAKKFHVNCGNLLKLNKITDP